METVKLEKIHAVYFSPTGTTGALAERLAARLAAALDLPMEKDDFTLPAARGAVREYGEGDLVVFGMPTYAGRLPNKILPFVQTLFRGNGAYAVPLVSFGNRSYDDSLKELRNELVAGGFRPFAAAAMAASHVFSDKIAPGRPDEKDLAAMDAWADRVLGLLQGRTVGSAESDSGLGSGSDLDSSSGTGRASSSQIPVVVDLGEDTPVGPYYTPLGQDGKPAKFLKAVPRTDPALCDGCGICAGVCPMGSISVPADGPSDTPGVCIKCQACIRRCPRQARSFTDPDFLSHVTMLEEHYQRRAEPAFFP